MRRLGGIPFRFRRRSAGRIVSFRSALPALGIVGALLIGDIILDGRSGPYGGGDAPRILNGGNAWGGSSRTPMASVPAGALTGRVSHVRDGDTVEVNGVAVRLANLDCAERGTPQGERATRRMRALVQGQRLTCRLSGRRSYDRSVGNCRLQDGRDLGQVLISQRLCKRWS